MLIPIIITGRDADYGYISGTVDENDAPQEGHVVDLFTRTPRLWVRSTLSQNAGVYQFDALDNATEYDVVARHKTRSYEDVIVGAVLPEPYAP